MSEYKNVSDLPLCAPTVGSLRISYKDHVTNEEVRAKIQQAIAPHEYLLFT